MAMAILLQLLLEGKGENYIPEVPKDTGKSLQKRRFASRDDDEDRDEDDEENQIEIAR
jgi:hypothetical protein